MIVKYKEILLIVDSISFNLVNGFSAICYLKDKQCAFLNNIDAEQLKVEDDPLTTFDDVCLSIPEQDTRTAHS